MEYDTISSMRGWIGLLCLLVGTVAAVPSENEGILPLPGTRGDTLGHALGLHRDVLVVSAPGRSVNASSTGVLHLLQRRDGRWIPQEMLEIEERHARHLGRALALDETTLVVGEVRHSEPVTDAGAVRVFDLDAGTVSEEPQTLRLEEPRIGDSFGSSVAISGDLLVVGAHGVHAMEPRSGAAFVYRRGPMEWKLQQRLHVPAGRFGDEFGAQVAIHDGRILIAARNESQAANGAGAVYVFQANGSAPKRWRLTEKILPPSPDPGAAFGSALATASSFLAVGAPGEGAGKAYLYEWTGSAYRPLQELTAEEAAVGARFGSAIDMNTEVLAVGAPSDPAVEPDGGRVYLFRRRHGTDPGFRPADHVSSPSLAEGDRFGAALEIEAGELFVGAPGTASATGAVYVFDLARLLATHRSSFVPLSRRALPRSPVRSMLQDDRGLLWMGTDEALLLFDGHRVRRFEHDPDDEDSLPPGAVLALLPDAEGKHWIGTEDGLAHFDPGRGTFVRHRFPRSGGYARQSFVALLETSDGSIWTGTNGRLYRRPPDGGAFEVYEPFTGPPETLDEPYVSGIGEHPDGRLWVLSKNLWENRASLYRIDLDRDRIVRYPVASEWGQVGPLLVSREGDLWLQAPAPAILPDQPGEPVRPRAPPVEAVHWDLMEDPGGTVWAATDAGLYRRAPGERIGSLQPVVSVPGPAFAANRVLSLTSTREGTLLLGTGDGPYRLLGEQLEAPPSAPPASTRVLLTGAEVSGPDGTRRLPVYDRIPGDDEARLRLGPREYNLSLYYAAPTFADPERTRYRYRLDGFDRGWVDAGSRSSALYTEVPPGNYTFRVEAEYFDSEGHRRSARPLVAALRVEPPFWQSWWFRLLAIALVGIIGLVLVRARHRHVRELKELRRRIANDVHDDLSTNASGIALVTKMILRDRRLPERLRAQLRRVATTADAMMTDLRDIVWLVDPDRDTAGDLLTKIRSVTRDLLSGLDYEIEVDPEVLSGVDMMRRRQLYLMFKELLHNVARHADARQVRIRIVTHGEGMRLTVQDDGIGFDPQTAQQGTGHGLASLRARARRLNGRVNVDSTPGHGTRVDVIMEAVENGPR